MHIPDGFLSNELIISTGLISVGVFYLSVKKLSNVPPKRIPLMGMAAAWVFAVQLVSFPIIGGTSVHLSGVPLIAILLGPFSACMISFSTLLLSAIMFQHGGVYALGANFINIGFVGGLLTYILWKLRPRTSSVFFILPIVSVTSAFLCSLELAYSGRLDFKTGFIAMGAAHLIEGLIEAFVTSAILTMIYKLKPSLEKATKL
ncbi:MAG: energy-coupling factor ABC transporter permease [Elusimicrobiota bacterium]|nr:energy-coupling factor ABC transporter permease [Elusimicrobiota bacterium]